MNQRIVWLDCDVGTDDAAAILCANQLPELKIVAISAVWGNVELSKTYPNALRLNRLMGTDYPVYRGAEKPLIREAFYSHRFHGENGLGGVELPLPEQYAETTEPAWDALYRTAKAYCGALEVIATGPQTNLALALLKHPDLPQYISRIVFMGGAAVGGNCTPSAEFNIYADPEAAQIVMQSGIPLVMCGLDVTNHAVFTAEELDYVGRKGSAAARLFRDCLQTPLQTQRGVGTKLHDAVAVLYAARPELFSGRMAGVAVETRGRITRGKTVTDLYSDKKFERQNAFVVLSLDNERFKALVTELIWAY